MQHASDSTKSRGHVFRSEPYEDMTWNQKRFPKPRLFRELATVDFDHARLEHSGFLHTRGNYGWLLIGPVRHDGDLYVRACARRTRVFGAASALRELGMPEAAILSERAVIALALEQSLYLRLENHATKRRYDVAMLHPWMKPGLPRTCGIYLDEAGTLMPLNPEEPTRYNTPQVRYSIVAGLTDGALAASLLLTASTTVDGHWTPLMQVIYAGATPVQAIEQGEAFYRDYLGGLGKDSNP